MRGYLVLQEGPCKRVQDEGYGFDVVLPRFEGVAGRWRDIFWIREVHLWNPLEIPYAWLLGHGYSSRYYLEERGCFYKRGSWCHYLQTIGGVLYVLGGHKAQ